MIVLVCILLYLVVGSLTGGYIKGANEDKGYCKPDSVDLFGMGAGWPITWFWFGFLKPITKIGVWVARKKEERTLTRIRVKQAQEEQRRLRIAEGMPAVEEFMAGEEDTHREPKRMRKS